MNRHLPAAGASQQRCHRRTRASLTLAGLALAVLLPLSPARSIPSDGIETPLPTRVDRFNPDLQVCTPEAIRRGYVSQMQPWADQPPAVVARLREVQLEMTRSTLRRCVSKGLMDRAQAEQLFAQLISQPSSPPTPSAGPAPAPASGSTAPPPSSR